ncbi:hypothetical protein SUGI_0778730 [Cryptomeria japonica]|nr:hypothetical protein SUGI_0778730 [Cryptomeria japonica]
MVFAGTETPEDRFWTGRHLYLVLCHLFAITIVCNFVLPSSFPSVGWSKERSSNRHGKRSLVVRFVPHNACN